VLIVVMDETPTDLYARHAGELVRFATGLVGPSDAPDVVSEAMVRLIASAPTPRKPT